MLLTYGNQFLRILPDSKYCFSPPLSSTLLLLPQLCLSLQFHLQLSCLDRSCAHQFKTFLFPPLICHPCYRTPLCIKAQFQNLSDRNVLGYGVLIAEKIFIHLLQPHLCHHNLHRQVYLPPHDVPLWTHPYKAQVHPFVEPSQGPADPRVHPLVFGFKKRVFFATALKEDLQVHVLAPFRPKILEETDWLNITGQT